MSQFKKLFEPGMIGKVRIRNRIISSPMERNYAGRDGSVTQRYIDNLVAKAKGGVGLILTESTYVDPRGKGRVYQLGCYDDKLIPGLKRMTDAVHKHGAKIGLELHFGGGNNSRYHRISAHSAFLCSMLGERGRYSEGDDSHRD